MDSAKATILAALITVLGGFGTVVLSAYLSRETPPNATDRVESEPPGERATVEPSELSTRKSYPDIGSGKPTGPRMDRKDSDLPVDILLRDGELETILGGQVSLEIEFNKIGREEFLTLRVGTPEKGITTHALLSSGARLKFETKEINYYLSVLRTDPDAKSATVRVASASTESH